MSPTGKPRQTAKPETDGAASGMAVATLLRLAAADLEDAAVLAIGRNPVNAPALAAQAVTRMVAAVAVTEDGRRGGGLAALPDANPLKTPLAQLRDRLPPTDLPAPGPDGHPPPPPDRDGLRASIAAARTLLQDLAARLAVELAGEGPAGTSEPIRAEPKPTPRPPQPARAVPPPPAAPPRPSPPQRPDQPQDAIPAAPPREVAGPAALSPSHGPGSVTSAAFWSLMDRWNVPDQQALDLVGHAGGLTKKGGRPRFKLVGAEIDTFLGLQEIDRALLTLELDPGRWLHARRKDGPFRDAAPLAYLVQARGDGVRATIRFLLQNGLKLSMSRAASG